MSTTAEYLVTHADVGSVVQVSNNGVDWESKILARILVDGGPEDENEANRTFVCWADDIDGTGKPSAYTHTFTYARRESVTPGGMTLEQRYVVEKANIKEAEDHVKQLKANLAALEQAIQENWILSGVSKQEIRIGERRVSLTLGNALYCNVLKANRESLKECIKEIGLEGVVVEDVDTSKLKAWLIENATTNDDGTYDLSFVPKEIADRISVYQCGKLSTRSIGMRG